MSRRSQARVAAALRSLADRAGLDRGTLRDRLAARGVDVSASTVSYWLTGQRLPSGPALVAVLDCLDAHGDERVAVVALAHPWTTRIRD